MGKRTLTALIVPFLVFACLLVSCEEDAATASLRINLDPAVRSTRAIVPEGVPLDVVKYRIEGNGPNGQTFTVTTTRHQATVDGLQLGRWTLTATGLSSQDMPLVKGGSTFTLTPGTRSCVIHVGELVGKGSLSVSLTWKDSLIEDPRVVICLTPQNGKKITETPVLSGSTLTWRKDSLPAGSYIFQAQLFSGNHLMAGLTEAVRIVDQKTSSEALTFSLDDFPYSDGTLQIFDSTGTPIECVIEGVRAEMESGKPIDVSLTPQAIPSEPILVKWYLDGTECGTDLKSTFSALPGKHRLDAVAYTTKTGSYGSASVTFEAVIRTAKGVPGNGTRYTAADGLKLGTDTAITYADNNLLVASGENRSLQVADLIRNQIDIVQEYGASAIGELAFRPQGMLISGTPIDRDGSYGIFMTVNSFPGTSTPEAPDTETTGVKLVFDPATRSIVRVQDTGAIEYPEAEGFTTILKHYPGIGWDAAKNCFVTMVTTYTNDQKGKKVTNNIVTRSCTTKEIEEYFADYAYDVDFRYAQEHPGQNYADADLLAVSDSGLEYLIGGPSGIILRTEAEWYEGTVNMGRFRDTCLTPSKYLKPVAMKYSRADNVYIAGAGYIGVLDADKNQELQYLSLSGSNIRDLEINPQTDNVYALDGTGKKVLTWTIGPDGKLSGMKETPVHGVYDSMEISQDGSKLALWNRADADAVEVLRILTK